MNVSDEIHQIKGQRIIFHKNFNFWKKVKKIIFENKKRNKNHL